MTGSSLEAGRAYRIFQKRLHEAGYEDTPSRPVRLKSSAILSESGFWDCPKTGPGPDRAYRQ